ncbi:MAG: thiamine pyrophosphate enzyme-like protein [Dehalococcoidia bacterium]|nr:thiamine pyrophosphate enzyme-like protein [Dehalococcoidia bacterium]
MDQGDAMAVLQELRGDAVVITAMAAIEAWAQKSKLPSRDLPIADAMGKASSVALGLALARPEVKVIVLDGDGSLLSNLGTLATIAGKAPKNLYHFVLENGVYATTGGQPIPAQGLLSFARLALAAGYASAYEFDNLEEFTANAWRILEESGPGMVCLKTVPEIRSAEQGVAPQDAPWHRSPLEMVADLRKSLGTA